MTADEVLEAMARGMWIAFCAAQTHPENWPSWEELKAQGHQGRHRVNEFLRYAAAAIRAVTERGGLVVAKVPEERDKFAKWRDDVLFNNGYNAALAAVRASAVEVE
jgi:hypothetical protein